MSTAIAKILAATVIVLALLGGMVLLVIYKAPPEAIAGVSTAFGIAVAAVVPMVTGKDGKGPPGVAAVLLASGLALAGESSCATPPVPLPQPTVQQKEDVAEVKYTDQLVECTANNDTAVMNKCISDTRSQWHRLPDGGAQ